MASAQAAAYAEFCREQSHWLADHALFEALKARDTRLWSEWPQPLRDREPEALAAALDELASEVEREQRRQFFFFQQWRALKAYANARGLFIFGDTPLYVSYDSVDVWLQPQLFQLAQDKQPLAVAGVPPDYFSATGQLWNNPLYDWAAMEHAGFSWWQQRMQALLDRFDVVRIDHFRGLVQYWSVPAGAESALSGHWADVPSHALFDALRARFDPFPVVAEDLGTITPDVVAVKEHYGFPGMVVLHFAFSGDNEDNPYRPENHPECAIAYLGTHDNTTTRDWLDAADEATLARLQHYTGPLPEQHAVHALIRLLLSSRARIAIVCAQDLLELPAWARMNDPGQRGANWSWRLSQPQFDALPLDWLGELCARYQR
jgi:4-alpha-glucanotransferase